MLAAGGLSVLLGTRGRGKRPSPWPSSFSEGWEERARLQHHGPIGVEEYPPLDVVAHRPRQGQALDVAALGD